MKELIKVQKDYIEFLGKHIGNHEIMAQNRGIMPSNDAILEGREFRGRIEELESQLQEERDKIDVTHLDIYKWFRKQKFETVAGEQDYNMCYVQDIAEICMRFYNHFKDTLANNHLDKEPSKIGTYRHCVVKDKGGFYGYLETFLSAIELKEAGLELIDFFNNKDLAKDVATELNYPD